MNRTKVLHVITNLEVGGAEAMLYKLLVRQERTQFASEVVSLISLGKFGPRIEALGIPCRALGFAGFLGSIIGFFKLTALVMHSRPQIIHGWLIHGSVVASLSAIVVFVLAPSRPKISVIWGIRNSVNNPNREGLFTRLCLKLGRWISKHPWMIIYNSTQGRIDYERLGFSPERTSIIPNGFETEPLNSPLSLKSEVEQRLNDPAVTHCIGTFARFHPMKGHLNLIQAAQVVTREFPNALFILAGRGVSDSNKILMEEIEALNLRKNFLLLGELGDVRILAPYLDLHVLPSSWGEGFPNVLGEMMLEGVPCVATMVGASQEIIGDAGLAVPASDPLALASAITKILHLSPDDRSALGFKARQRILQNFSIDQVVKQYESLYELAAASS